MDRSAEMLWFGGIFSGSADVPSSAAGQCEALTLPGYQNYFGGVTIPLPSFTVIV